jgi:hypothetical protein
MAQSPAAPPEQGPLAPLDTSSPKATLLSFAEQTARFQAALAAYRADKSNAG